MVGLFHIWRKSRSFFCVFKFLLLLSCLSFISWAITVWWPYRLKQITMQQCKCHSLSRYNLHHKRRVKHYKKFSSCPNRCWITDINTHYVVNIGYYCFVFIFTFSIFIVILRWICMLRQKRWKKMEKLKGSKTGTSDITTVMGLCCMLGVTWSFSFFSFGALRVPSYYIFTILNSFQGERVLMACSL